MFRADGMAVTTINCINPEAVARVVTVGSPLVLS